MIIYRYIDVFHFNIGDVWVAGIQAERMRSKQIEACAGKASILQKCS
jgi:hypothetical protein